jgi:hypothetical protein
VQLVILLERLDPGTTTALDEVRRGVKDAVFGQDGFNALVVGHGCRLQMETQPSRPLKNAVVL